ncbi:hypothetical protein ARMGADRAFT_935529 [Armillaria gallica]|uniref:T6SS Phospholipase effector Tle1-like catalytic domain-containing protein n=1 Tax=Armillaria gallica TaxID=47427 RepID=A0A2H3D304_ARMGA|nr:hypothetical protein ARMGADRAFT_935529 [Armillaria gallica]
MQCGSHKSYRNLVVCLDGTANQFGHRNTNVVELHNRILKGDPDVPQLTFYSSGIGTYVPPSTCSIAHWLHMFDKAFAWSFKRLVEEAYRWIADHYQPGDRLFLFGFSRGAYQVRALAGMIEKLGLVFSGNKGLIPFAYELYSDRHKGIKAEALALNFKRTFARPVRVHFVGVWDTVSSVGIAQTQPLPLTKSASHICFFRHGLALDERRVKFLPEYLAGGRSPLTGNEHYEEPPNAKEVWFPGRHSDMYALPLLWMENEAGAAGLKLAPRRGGVEWRWDDHHLDKPKNKLGWYWWPIEILPVKRLRYTDKESTTRKPHLGRGRSIVPSQLIHASLAFKQDYTPSAVFIGTTKAAWKPLIGIGNVEDLSWADEWQDVLEMDLFDHSVAQVAIQELQSLRSNSDVGKSDVVRQVVLLKRLSFMALSS